MLTSTPKDDRTKVRYLRSSIAMDLNYVPVMVPLIIVPFFSSMITVSLLSFIKNLARKISVSVMIYSFVNVKNNALK
jgi:hypothetical protein